MASRCASVRPVVTKLLQPHPTRSSVPSAPYRARRSRQATSTIRCRTATSDRSAARTLPASTSAPSCSRPATHRPLAFLQKCHGHDRQYPVHDGFVHVQACRRLARNPGDTARRSARPHTSRSTRSRPMTCLAPMPAEDVPLGHVLGIRLGAVVAARLETLDQGVVDLGGLGFGLGRREELPETAPRHLRHPGALDGFSLRPQVAHDRRNRLLVRGRRLPRRLTGGELGSGFPCSRHRFTNRTAIGHVGDLTIGFRGYHDRPCRTRGFVTR